MMKNFYGINLSESRAMRQMLHHNADVSKCLRKIFLGCSVFATMLSASAQMTRTTDASVSPLVSEVENGVVYDLDIISTNPAKGALDLTYVTWDVMRITVKYEYNYRPDAMVRLENAKGTYEREVKLEDSSFTADTRTFKMIYPPEPSQNGTYTLTIPQGTFGDAAWLENPETGHSNPEIKVVWRVYGASGTTAEYDLEVSSTSPADNGTIDIKDNPFEITVTAPGELNYVPYITADLVNPESDYVGKVSFVSPETVDGSTTFKTVVTPPVTRNGVYTLTIPEGMFGDLPYAADCSEGHGNKAYTMSFEVTGGEAPKDPIQYDMVPVVTPADGANVSFDEIKRLLFVFPEGTDWIDEDTAKAVLRCSTANYYSSALFRREPDTPGAFYLNFGTKPFREGVYTLVLNKGLFFDADKAHSNPEITYNWNVSAVGIDTISEESDVEYGVYDMNGVYMGKTAKGLPSGVYVVKGRKVYVSEK